MNLITSGRAIAESALALSPWVPAPKPRSAVDVDATWITAVFGQRVPGAVALRVETMEGTSGLTDRRRLAIEWNAAGQDAGLPTGVFVKATPLSAKNRAMVAALDMAMNEVGFYKAIRPGLGDDVAPQVYACHAGHGGRYLLLLEDLVGAGATFLESPHALDLPYAEGVVRALGHLHAAFWDSPRLNDDLSWIASERQRPGFAVMLWQFRRMRKKLLASTEYELPPPVRRMAEFVNHNDHALHAKWKVGPQTVLHGDGHAGNTYGLPDGRSGLLDWQLIQRGPGIREISYFFTHSLPIELRRQHQEDLIRLYLSTLQEYGLTDPPTFDEAWQAYRFFVFDAWDFIGLCAVWPGLQPPDYVEEGFRRANATVADLEVDKAVMAALS